LEEYLFDLGQFRSVNKVSGKVENEEKPFLEPIWRDSTGAYHHARFNLIYRSFALTRLHEHVFRYVGQHEVNCSPCSDFPSKRFDNRLEEFLASGWPQPKLGGDMRLFEKHSTKAIYEITIYCDDLFICPECGEFHPYRRTPEDDCPWLFSQGRLIDHVIVQRVIEARRDVPEFRFAECGGAHCAENRARVIARMKEREDAKARTAAFNAELARHADNPQEGGLPPRSSTSPPSFPPRSAFVYAVQGGEHVKIGLTSNVRNRVLVLQTSCPVPLSVLNAWQHYNAPKMEKLLHRKFRSRRTLGEWFRLGEDELSALRGANRIEDLLHKEPQ
jgi:hypothetical protein